MVIGGFSVDAPVSGDINNKITVAVVITCIVAGTTGLIFGYDIEISVTLGHVAVPACIMTIGALLISDTPSSLMKRGTVDQARQSLRKVQGKGCVVESELVELKKASEVAKEANQEPFMTIFKRQYMPHLVMSIAIPFFQQVTRINIIAFYAPALFQYRLILGVNQL
ncbi:General substrate transporter [Corchorus olitorius]|uniref:General substrate transporter n=1 Tax=Corchorus olitorius TaxID=93759 RepID=A0A1R3JHK9_9ROSI|nr:General substrate transporter [Corchorus olitorius]